MSQQLAMFPIRIVLYSILMILLYPLVLIITFFNALYLRIKKGKVSDILQYGGRMSPGNIPYEEGIHYAAQLVYTKPFSDHDKANKILIDIAKSCGIPAEKVKIVFETEIPTRVFPPSGPVDGNYYIPKHVFIKEAGSVKGCIVYLRIWNGEDGEPTVVFYNGAAGTWDGSSNFNFIREFSARYWSDKVNEDFFQGDKLPLHPESKALLDSKSSFGLFLVRMPWNIFRNLSAMLWQLLKAAQWAGGPGIGFEVTMFNLNEEDSKLLLEGSKLKGVTPYAAMTYASVKAYRAIYQENPVAILQQSSLMTRHFAGELKGRDYVGDWLIGPLQFVGNKPYTLKEAGDGYSALIKGLETLDTVVVYALEAKAWGLSQGGAGVFELFPTYNDASVLFNTVFFNNYGVRTMDGPFFSFNWCAPFRLCCNSICVNGKTSTCMASCVTGVPQLNLIRDDALRILKEEIIEPARAAKK